MRPTRVVVADRYPVVLRGLGEMLGAEADFEIVASCDGAASCIEAIRTLMPDIAILDPTMPGLIALKDATESGSPTHMAFLAPVAGYELFLLSAFDGCSVLLKEASFETLLRSLRQIANGQTIVLQLSADPLKPAVHGPNSDDAPAVLTERERQIMRLVSEGLSNKEIGRRLNIADGTIKVHLHHVFQKLEISNRTALAALVVGGTYDKLML